MTKQEIDTLLNDLQLCCDCELTAPKTCKICRSWAAIRFLTTWSQMADAPRDGTEILVDAGDGMVVAAWMPSPSKVIPCPAKSWVWGGGVNYLLETECFAWRPLPNRPEWVRDDSVDVRKERPDVRRIGRP